MYTTMEKSELAKEIDKSTKADRITLLAAMGEAAKDVNGYYQDGAILIPTAQLPDGWSVEEVVITCNGETKVGRVNGWEEYHDNMRSKYTKIKVIEQ